MSNEQVKTLEALQFAIQMEIDGKEYYQKASQESGNKLGKELFQWLAAEEEKHQQQFEKIYNAIKSRKAWQDIDIQADWGKRLKTLFAEAMKAKDTSISASRSELNAVAKAMDMENKTHDFYSRQGEKAVYEAEKELYKALAAEEQGHYLALVDYQEYLIDPASWFFKSEHPSLDGG